MGYQAAADELRDEIAEQYEDEGFDPEEIDELLYDPAPRRGGRGRKRRVRRRGARRSLDPAPRRRKSSRRKSRRGVKRYDPAPKRRRGRGRRGVRRYDVPKTRHRKKKGMLKLVLDNAGIIAGGGKFIMDYAARADALKLQGSIDNGSYAGIFEAIQFDMVNFKMADASARVQKVFPTVALQGVAGMVLKSSRVNSAMKGYGKPAGDVLLGVAIATAAKAILDPPIVRTPARRQPAMAAVQMPQNRVQIQPQIQTQETYIPWGY